jgi:hypothetical protein
MTPRSSYFDSWNSEHYAQWLPIYSAFSHKVGGVRKRVLGTNVCLHKFPLFRFDFAPLRLAPGAHYFRESDQILHSSDRIRLYDQAAVLLHFKFIKPDFAEFIARRVARDEDWNGSAEYKSYQRAMHLGELRLFDPAYSRRLIEMADLDPFFSLLGPQP